MANSGDVFRHNIIWTTCIVRRGCPARLGAQEMDFNLVQNYRRGDEPSPGDWQLQQQSGRDEHSIVTDAQFVDPAHGDYRVKPGSPALAMGFKNFPMDQFGVQQARNSKPSRVFRSCRSPENTRDPRHNARAGRIR